jgi:hypothetical protein
MQPPRVVKEVQFSDREIFDGAGFDRAIEGMSQPLTEFRQALKDGTDRLEALFHEGLSAAQLIPTRARLIDRLL